jgi:hypothetical protein
MADSTSVPSPGYKTTEFWLSLAAKLLGALFAAGVLGDGTPAMRIAGLAAAVLTQLGYTVSRGIVKAAVALLLVGVLAGPQLACVAAKAEVSTLEAGVLRCSKADEPAAKALALQLGTEAFADALAGMTSDQIWTQVSGDAESAAGAQGLAIASCAFGDLVAQIDRKLHPAPVSPNAQPVARAALVDPLAGAHAALSAFQTKHGITRIAP